MDTILTILGALMFPAALAGVALGLYMASNRATRTWGLFFALWWVPAAAAAAGVMMRDPVTFFVGAFCFAIAGAALAIEYSGRHTGWSSDEHFDQQDQVTAHRLPDRTTEEGIETDESEREAAEPEYEAAESENEAAELEHETEASDREAAESGREAAS